MKKFTAMLGVGILTVAGVAFAQEPPPKTEKTAAKTSKEAPAKKAAQEPAKAAAKDKKAEAAKGGKKGETAKTPSQAK